MSHYMSHGFCLMWNARLVWMHVLSDFFIWTAYLLIPLQLLKVYRRVHLKWFSVTLFAWFALFIFSCGMTHLMDIITMWKPIYWIAGGVKAITAVSSLVTYILLRQAVPAMLEVPHHFDRMVQNDRELKEIMMNLGRKFDNVET